MNFEMDEIEAIGPGPADTSLKRYLIRRVRFQADGKPLPRTRHFLWWLLHNCVAHPCLLIPAQWSFRFHDWSSDRLNHRPTNDAKDAGDSVSLYM